MDKNKSLQGQAIEKEDTHDPQLRILRIATDLYPEQLGGGALHVHKMSELQAEMGHDVTVLTSDHGERDLPQVEQRDGYEIRRNREALKLFGNSIMPGTLGSIIDRVNEYDIVHAHSHLYFSTNLAALTRRLSETPLVLTNHGLVSQTAPAPIQKVYLPTVGQFTFQSADRILCYTETDRDRLRDRDVTAPISVIHNGIDCETFRPTEDGDKRSQLLYVGRLKQSKGVDRMLRAFDKLAETHPDLTVKVVGEGPQEEELKELCEQLGIEDRVTFTGTLPNDDLPPVYAESLVFVLPSDAEGLPRTVLESLSCGTPVVTSELPQLESVVDGCGYQVPAEAIDELATAIDRVVSADQPEYRTMSERGRQRVKTEYSWQGTVEKTTSLYYELLDGTIQR